MAVSKPAPDWRLLQRNRSHLGAVGGRHSGRFTLTGNDGFNGWPSTWPGPRGTSCPIVWSFCVRRKGPGHPPLTSTWPTPANNRDEQPVTVFGVLGLYFFNFHWIWKLRVVISWFYFSITIYLYLKVQGHHAAKSVTVYGTIESNTLARTAWFFISSFVKKSFRCNFTNSVFQV